MPSPFPGMDPYVEATGIWSSFHHAFLAACADQLNERLPEGYAAVLDERIQLLGDEDLQNPSSLAEPDIGVLREPASHTAPMRDEPSVATLPPRIIPQSTRWLDVPKQLSVEIVRLPEQRLVTHIELLSPSNKRRGGEDRLAYLAKRRSVLYRRINLVEIDLLIGGERLPLLEPLPEGHFFAFVTRREAVHQCEVFAWDIRQPLPTILIPLEPQDKDVLLDLATPFDRVYHRGRYARLLRYQAPLELPLSPADCSWAVDRAKSGRS